MPANPAKTLLSPDNHSLLMIDHQYLQMLTIRSHDASELINHAVALVEAAAIFKVPMLTTTAFQERQGLVAPLAEATKAVKPIDRTTLNSWEDPRIVDWVKNTGRKKLVIAGQWTEGASREAHDMAVERMFQADAQPITTRAYVSELQRDWARAATAEQVTKLFARRGGALGQGQLWEWTC
jgi:nicotinamidase-related amidase